MKIIFNEDKVEIIKKIKVLVNAGATSLIIMKFLVLDTNLCQNASSIKLITNTGTFLPNKYIFKKFSLSEFNKRIVINICFNIDINNYQFKSSHNVKLGLNDISELGIIINGSTNIIM